MVLKEIFSFSDLERWVFVMYYEKYLSCCVNPNYGLEKKCTVSTLEGCEGLARRVESCTKRLISGESVVTLVCLIQHQCGGYVGAQDDPSVLAR